MQRPKDKPGDGLLPPPSDDPPSRAWGDPGRPSVGDDDHKTTAGYASEPSSGIFAASRSHRLPDSTTFYVFPLIVLLSSPRMNIEHFTSLHSTGGELCKR